MKEGNELTRRLLTGIWVIVGITIVAAVLDFGFGLESAALGVIARFSVLALFVGAGATVAALLLRSRRDG